MRLEPEIVGRDTEIASLRAFIDEAKGGASALVLEGEAGIGKSTLWDVGLEHARGGGTTVLSSRPVEAESGLAHTGIGDLPEDVPRAALPEPSRPRRRAREVAPRGQAAA